MTSPHEQFRASILAALGYAPDTIEPGRFQRFATRDRRGDSAGWCKLFDDMRGGVFGCYRQGISETWSATDKRQMNRGQRIALAQQIMAATAEREAAQRRQWAESAERIAELWAQCVPLVPGDPVALYLKRRGLVGVWPLPEVLRLHRALPYWHEGEKLRTLPAMVAPIVAPDGRTVALHRTYLAADGDKADVPTVKKLTAAAGPLAGASIPLHKPANSMGIAEGIETALAAWCAFGVPTVAAYCAGNLAAWQWPASVRRIIVFADADEAGAEAARKLRRRAIVAGLSVSVAAPKGAGTDWCDAWARGDVASRKGAEA